MIEGIPEVKNKIVNNIELKKIKIFALSLSYAGKAINMFRSFQDGNVFWDNQTNQAKDRMFSGAFREEDIEDEVIGWFLSHGVLYGIYLELANDRQNESIKPIIDILSPQFFREVRAL